MYKQKKPFDRPLSYHTDFAKITNLYKTKPSWGIDTDAWLYKDSTSSTSLQMTNAISLSYERLKGQIGDRPSMGENFLDLHESVRTIETRARQLFHIVRDLKKLNLGEVVRDVVDPRYSSAMKMSHPIKNVSGQWLEFHLGIEPVVKDIYAAIDHMQQPIKNVFCRSRAYGGQAIRLQTVDEGYRVTKYTRNVACYAMHQVEVAVSNPWLYLANSLGLVNPVQVAWQVTPLSFVADWFVNVEQFLGTVTDFLGLTTLNPMTTTYWNGFFNQTMVGTNYNSTGTANCGGMTRSLGITLPSLHFHPYKVPGVARAATAVALLVGGLHSLEKRAIAPKPIIYGYRKQTHWDQGYDRH
jgi:hypothetical protein